MSLTLELLYNRYGPFQEETNMIREEGFYWLQSERSSKRGVGQWFKGMWYLINEEGPISHHELIGRGWYPHSYIDCDTASDHYINL